MLHQIIFFAAENRKIKRLSTLIATGFSANIPCTPNVTLGVTFFNQNVKKQKHIHNQKLKLKQVNNAHEKNRKKTSHSYGPPDLCTSRVTF